MKYRKIAAIWAAALVAGGLVGASGLAANAAYAYGNYNYFNGYQGRSVLDNSTKRAGAETRPQSGSVAAGWLGVRGELYKQSTGALCTLGSWAYNPISSGGYTAGWTSGNCGAGAYQS